MALAANAPDAHQQRGRHAGMNGILGKPFEIDQLKQKRLHWPPEKFG